MNNIGPLISILLFINFLCIISVIYVERKRPQATIAWVIVMTFLPVIGAFFYILLGSTVIPRLTRRIKTHFNNYGYYMDTFTKYLSLNKEEILCNENNLIKKYRDIILLNINNNESLCSFDNDIKLYTDADEKYKDLFDDIENAKETINIEYFIIRKDEIGRKLVALLSRKAREGVKVNLLYDELGSLKTTKKFFSPIEKSGGQVCRFFTYIFSNLIRANNRNHRKIAVIDGKIGYVGGMNLGIEYTGKGKLTPWRDTHLRIEGSSVHLLQTRFLIDFITSHHKRFKKLNMEEYKIYFPKIENKGSKCMQIVTSGPDSHKEEIKYSYIKMINSAKKNIYIQTPYFVPDEALMESLKLAIISGVDVNLMIPGKPDKMYVYFITLSYIEELLEIGAKIYLYDGFIHSKTIVIDSEVSSIGTTNFDVRSFSLNYEINAVIYDEEFGKLNEEVFLKDTETSTLLELCKFKKRSGIRKIAERIFKLFSPLA